MIIYRYIGYGLLWLFGCLVFIVLVTARSGKRIFLRNSPEHNSILLLCNGRIGDVVLQIPAIRVIAEKYKDKKLVLAVSPEGKDILPTEYDNIEFFVYEKKNGLKKIFNLLRAANKLKNNGFDTIVSFNNSLESALLAFITGGNLRIGAMSQFSGFLLTSPIKDNRQIHEVERNLDIVRFLGIKFNDARLIRGIEVKAHEIKQIKEFLYQKGIRESDNIIALNPYSRQGYFWPLNNWAILSDTLRTRYNSKNILIGDKNSLEIDKKINLLAKEKIDSVVGSTSLMQLAALLSTCRLLITVDSAPMHIACACGTPVISIFGPTNHLRWGPFNEKSIVVRKDLTCAPCAPYSCRHMACLKGITVKEIFDAVDTFMQRNSK